MSKESFANVFLPSTPGYCPVPREKKMTNFQKACPLEVYWVAYNIFLINANQV